jgi:hypothetical protein
MRRKGKKQNALIGTLAGGVAGAMYFNLEESDIPKNSNAQYLAPISTDIAAWAFGALLVWKGFKYDDGLVSFIGSSIISIHISQFATHKVIKQRVTNE